MGHQTIVQLLTTAIFSAFAGYIFGTFRDKANIIIQWHKSLISFQLTYGRQQLLWQKQVTITDFIDFYFGINENQVC